MSFVIYSETLESINYRNFHFIIVENEVDIWLAKQNEKIGEFLILIEGIRISFISNRGTFSCLLETYLEDKAYVLAEAVFQTYFK